MILLSTKNLTKKYKYKYAVNNISFILEKNSSTALIGPNGAGKTTILRMLAGTIQPTFGKILLHDSYMEHDRRSLIGYLPQYPVFYSWMTGFEFLVFSGGLAHLSKKIARERAAFLLKKVGIYDAKDQRISHYSGGMKQRLGIAQAMIHNPKILILDEPVASLDPLGRREILDLFKRLKSELTILFSTHILADADEVSDKLILLNHGEIIEQGALEKLRQKYKPSSIQLEFSKIPYSFREKLQNISSIQSCQIHNQTVQLTVTNISEAREKILTLALKEKWSLINFNVPKASLEEMFMKVVK